MLLSEKFIGNHLKFAKVDLRKKKKRNKIGIQNVSFSFV